MGVAARLRIVPGEVTFADDRVHARHQPSAADYRIGSALRAVATARRRAGGASPSSVAIGRYVAALEALGRRLGECFLDGPVGAALTAAVQTAGTDGLRIEIDVPDPGLADLPWEAMVPPGVEVPLALDPRVQVCRTVPGGTGAAHPPSDGPLRILAVVASPEQGGDTLLDYEAEVDRLLAATDPVAHGGHGASVDVLEWGTLASIEEAVRAGAYHVLHVTAHALPGSLRLEDDDGHADDVSTERLATAVLAGDLPVPVVVLAACSTATGTDDEADQFAGLARGLLKHGVPTVVAMTSEVSDAYATELTGAFYHLLAAGVTTDPLTALTRARRELEEARRAAAPTAPGQNQIEWWVPALYTNGAAGPLYHAGIGSAGPRPERAAFVGRRGDLRALGRLLRSPQPFLLLYGLGGSGSRALAGMLAARLSPRPRLLRIRCDAGADGVVRSLREALGLPPQEIVGSWLHHFESLRPALLQGPVALVAEVPVAGLLPPQQPAQTDWRPADPQLTRFFAAWTRLLPAAPLMIIATARLTLGDLPVHRHQVGPLDTAEARKLARRLSTLDGAGQRRVQHAVGGHPGTYRRIGVLLEQGGQERAAIGSAVRASAGEAGLLRLAEHVDRQLLADVAVFEEPVETAAFTAPAAALDRLCASGLVARIGDRYQVDRWAARFLLRLWPAEAAAAHRRAAAHWRTVRRPADPAAALLHARDHLRAVGECDEALLVNEQACRLLIDVGRWVPAHTEYRRVRDWVEAGSPEHARITRAIGDLWALAGDDAEAETHFDRALNVFRRLPVPDETEIVETLRRLGDLALRTGEAARGRRLLDEARARAEALGTGAGIADTYRYLGLADLNESRYVEAEVHLHRALARFREEQDHRGHCLVQIDLGDLYRKQGRRDEATIAYGRARVIALEHLPSSLAINARCALRLGGIAEDRNDVDTAAQFYLAAREAYEVLRDLPGQARTHALLASLDERGDRPDAAAAAYRESLELAEDANDLQAQLRALAALSRLHREQGRTEEAVADAVRAFRLAEASATPDAISSPLEQLAYLSEAVGEQEFHRALASFTDADTAAHVRWWMRRHEPFENPQDGKIAFLRFMAGYLLVLQRRKPRQLFTTWRRGISGYLADRAWPTFLLAVVAAAGLIGTAAVLRSGGLPGSAPGLLFVVIAGVEVAGAAHLLTAVRGLRRARSGFAALIGQPVAWMAPALAWLVGLGCARAGFPVVPDGLARLIYPGFTRGMWGWPQLDLDRSEAVRLGGYALLAWAVFLSYAAVAARLGGSGPLTWPEGLWPGSPRRELNQSRVDVVVKMAKDIERSSNDPQEIRDMLIKAGARARATSLDDKAAEALAWAYDLDERTGRWDTLRDTVHELAARAAESVAAVYDPVDPPAVLEMLEGAAERDPVRGRAVLAAYCTHLWRHPPSGEFPKYLAAVAPRAMQLYGELMMTDLRRFRPYLAVAFADQAQFLRAGGDTESAVKSLRFAIETLKGHGKDVGWWRTDLAGFQAALAQWLIEQEHHDQAAEVVRQLRDDVAEHFDDPPQQLPPALVAVIDHLSKWATDEGCR